MGKCYQVKTDKGSLNIVFESQESAKEYTMKNFSNVKFNGLEFTYEVTVGDESIQKQGKIYKV